MFIVETSIRKKKYLENSDVRIGLDIDKIVMLIVLKISYPKMKYKTVFTSKRKKKREFLLECSMKHVV